MDVAECDYLAINLVGVAFHKRSKEPFLKMAIMSPKGAQINSLKISIHPNELLTVNADVQSFHAREVG